MNKIQQLIQQYCPDGVEWRMMGGIVTIQRGVRVVRNQLLEVGKYPVYQNSMKPLGYFDKANYKANTTFIISAGAAGDVGYSDVDFWAADDCFVCVCPETLTSKFLYYVMLCNQTLLHSRVRRASVPRLSRDVVEKLAIPIPPLPIQQEIVTILDTFTALDASLQAELEARRKQYEHYRDQLLSFEGKEVEWKTLGGICKYIVSGGTPSTNRRDYYGGDIPWLRTQEVDWNNINDTGVKITELGLSSSTAKWIKPNCVIVAMYGATAAKVAVNKIPLTTNQACCNLEINEEVANYRFVFHWICKEYENLKSLGEGVQSNINSQKIKNFPIPIPPLPIQHRIVSILDKFDALVNTELPAEIAARRKQYEYYREKLLTFKPLKS